MRTILIAYDPNRTARYYTDLNNAIQSLGETWHCLPSVFIVKTEKTVLEAGETLAPRIDVSDKLLVVELTGKAAFSGFPDTCGAFLNSF